MKTIISIDFDAKFQNRPPWQSLQKIEFCVEPIINFIDIFKMPTTIFIREDYETIQEYGLNYCYDLVSSIKNSHLLEFGWHPHFLSYDKNIITDEIILLHELNDIFRQSSFAKTCKLVRIGSCQSGNLIMKFLSENFEIDSSAMSQCVRKDDLRWYDWSTTYGKLYFPSLEDYRTSGAETYQILEVPITTIDSLAPYDKTPKRRILNPSINSQILKSAVEKSRQYLKTLDCLVIACHAEELQSGYSNDLHTYGLDNFFENLCFIESFFKCEYTTFSDLKKFCKKR